MDEVNANFESLKLAVDAFTTDFAAATAATETAAENTCNQAGGTWDAGTSTCTNTYHCFVGGYCSRAAQLWDPNEVLLVARYTNRYDGHSPFAGAALAAGCASNGGALWMAGVSALTNSAGTGHADGNSGCEPGEGTPGCSSGTIPFRTVFLTAVCGQ
jgi:hypothetical protein